MESAYIFVVFIGAAILVNSFSYKTRIKPSGLLPPGYIIGLVWIFLIACMAYAETLVLQNTKMGSSTIAYYIPGLFIYCILYPFYTGMYKNKTNRNIVNIANIGAVLLSSWVAYSVYDFSHLAGYLIGLTAVWSLYATIATLYTDTI